jgi:hypothetical protein
VRRVRCPTTLSEGAKGAQSHICYEAHHLTACRSLKDDPEFANRVELLQDFGFDEASQCVRVSEDGDWVMSTGTYKPQIHVHYLPHLSLSYARHTDTINQKFHILSSDASKSVHLMASLKGTKCVTC